jgi:hypothetical protein
MLNIERRSHFAKLNIVNRNSEIVNQSTFL